MKKAIALILMTTMAFSASLTASARTYVSSEPRFSEEMLDFAEYCKTHTYKQQIAHYADEFMGDDAGEMNFFAEEDFLQIKQGKNALIKIRYDLWDKYYYFVDEPHYILNFDFGLSNGIESASLFHYLNERDVFTVKELLRDGGIEQEAENLVVVRIDSIDMYMSGYNYKGYDFIPCEKGWNEIDGERYYVKKDGTLATSSLTIGGIRYKFDESGVCQGKYTGKIKSGNRIICYKDGVKQDELFTGWFKSGGKRFYAKDGVIRTGWVTVGSERYYIDPKEGRLPGAERISVKFPDGTVYESADGGKSWTVDGKKTKTPTLSARFETKRPAVFSEKSVLTIRNETGKEIDFGEVYELSREENGKWIPAEMDGYWSGEDVAYFIESDSERTTDVHTEVHIPAEGKYRYVLTLWEEEYGASSSYTITVDFRAVNAE